MLTIFEIDFKATKIVFLLETFPVLKLKSDVQQCQIFLKGQKEAYRKTIDVKIIINLIQDLEVDGCQSNYVMLKQIFFNISFTASFVNGIL